MRGPLILIGCMGVGLVARRIWRHGRAGRSLSLSSFREAPTIRTIQTIHRGNGLRPDGQDDISIISYNILADQFAANHRLLQYVHPDHLEWSHRRPLLVSELSTIDACLCCLQEVDAGVWQELLKALPGYHGVLQERKGSANESPMCAILYKPGRLKLVWRESRSRSLLAAFVFQDSYGLEQTLFVINAHLEGSPYRPTDRVSQMRNSLQRLQQGQQQMDKQPKDCTVVVCGDFNSGCQESVWRLLHRGRLEGGTTEAHLPHVEVTKATISHPYMLQDAYCSAEVNLPFTRKVPHLGSTLDHIFVSLDCEVRAVYNPLSIRLTDAASLSRLCLPNLTHPSDHLPIGAVIRLKQPSVAALSIYNSSTHPPEESLS